MYRDHTVGVVVPAYNEAGFVGEVVETLPEFVDRAFVVDDCSTDGTWAEIQQVAGVESASGASPGDELTDGSGGNAGLLEAERDSDAATGDAQPSGATPGSPSERSARSASDRVVPIRHEENRGVGGAIKTGYQRAREEGLDVTVVVGADGQMDPDRMPTLIDPIVEGKAEYTTGNRLLNPDHHEEMPFHRVVGNGILTLLTKIATGYWQVGDPQMGYTAISLEALEEADVDGMYEYFGYCNDLLVRLSTADMRVADVPCPLHYGDEESHITYSSYVPRVSSMLLGSFLRRLWVGKGSAAGAARLVLFVGGALAVAAGLLGSLVGGLRSALDDADAAEERDRAVEDADRDGIQFQSESDDTDSGVSHDGIEIDVLDDSTAVDDRIAADAHEAAEPTSGPDLGDGADAPEADATENQPTTSTRSAPADGPQADSCRSKLAIVGGVAALLAAMLVDATTNATKNYTDRLPEEYE